ncbi:ABC transporter permease [Agrobacterium tumefaciens]|uniref:ABC transporter permease n=1 Tax=Agrobacterium tumefaciens TaxID=358 RepID=UPI00023A1D9B|nr:ABC transporter permease [Agrobacterium tumefaciens 5A]
MAMLATSAHRKPLILLWPLIAVAGFFGIPFVLLIRTSFARLDPARYEGSGWSLDSFASLLEPLVVNGLAFSVGLALIAATISMIVAFPATYFITRMSRRAQVAWLVGFLTTLALSEVLVTFTWQILLSKRAGISNIAVFLGLMDSPVSLTPNFWAVASCLVYLVIPFNVMTLYPGLSRIDSSYMEAAATMGAKPLNALLTVLIPLMRKPFASAYLTTVVLSIGSYVAPLILGGPSNWTIGVIISEVATQTQNLPHAAAIAIFLMFITGLLILVINKVGGKGYSL